MKKKKHVYQNRNFLVKYLVLWYPWLKNSESTKSI